MAGAAGLSKLALKAAVDLVCVLALRVASEGWAVDAGQCNYRL